MARKKVKPTQLKVKVPFGIGELTFTADEVQQRAAWSLYVQLVTRVAVQPLDEDQGLLREALSSLYAIFGITRRILEEAGPEVANGPESLGPIAIAVLNQGLRPFLSYWHPRLLGHEQLQPEGNSQLDHERMWIEYDRMRAELANLQKNMRDYADVLAEISGAK